MAQAILPIFPEDVTVINGLLSFARREGTVWYFMGCIPMYFHPETDLNSFRMLMSQFIENGNCKQVDIVRAFGISAISVKRLVKKYRQGGVASFYVKPKKRKPRVLTPEVLSQTQNLLNAGSPRAAVAQALGLKLNTLSKAILAGRLVAPVTVSAPGVSKSEQSVADSQAGMGCGSERSGI
jgi:transposase